MRLMIARTTGGSFCVGLVNWLANHVYHRELLPKTVEFIFKCIRHGALPFVLHDGVFHRQLLSVQATGSSSLFVPYRYNSVEDVPRE